MRIGTGRAAWLSVSTPGAPKLCWTTAVICADDRTVFPEVPLHLEYSLTELGHSANVPLAHLRNWALDNLTRVLNLNPAGRSS